MKRYLVTAFLLACTSVSQAQSIFFHDLIDLVTMSIPQVDNVLLQNGRFKIKDKADEGGQVITYYQSIDKNKNMLKGETIINGWYQKASGGVILHSITYKTIYPEYVLSMIKEMKKYGYYLSFKGSDTMKKTFIYDNALNHITVTMLNDHSLNLVEVKQKEMEIDQ